MEAENKELRAKETSYNIIMEQNKELKKTLSENKKQIEALIQRATKAETQLELINGK